MRELEKAAEGDEPDGVILDHLGDAYLKLAKPANKNAGYCEKGNDDPPNQAAKGINEREISRPISGNT